MVSASSCGAIRQLAADLDEAAVDDCGKLGLAAGECLGDFAGALDQRLVDLPRTMVERLGDAVSIAFERLGDRVDRARIDWRESVSWVDREVSMLRAWSPAAATSAGPRSSINSSDGEEAVLRGPAPARPSLSWIDVLDSCRDDLVVDRDAAAFDSIGDVAAGSQDLLVDGDAAAFDGVADMLRRLDDRIVDGGAAALDRVGDLAARRKDAFVDRAPPRVSMSLATWLPDSTMF